MTLTAAQPAAPARQPTSADVSAHTFPVLLVRVAGVSSAQLDLLRLTRTSALLSSLEAAEAAEAASADAAGDALYAAVPSLDRQSRRVALRLRRTMHNHRTPPAAELLTALEPALATLALNLLHEWIGSAERLASIREQLEQTADNELCTAGRHLLAACRGDTLGRAISIATPVLSRALESADPATTPPPGDRLARSCFGYLMRAAVKLSPYSSLTTVTFAGRGAPDPKDDPVHPGSRRRVTISPVVATELLDAVAGHPELARVLSYRRVDVVHRIDGHRVALTGRTACTDGFFWRYEQTATVDGYDRLLGPVARLEPERDYSVAELVEQLGPDIRLGRLVELGLLTPVAPWAGTDVSQVDLLADRVMSVESPAGQRLTALLHDIAESPRALPARGLAQRRDVVDGLRRATTNAFIACDRPSPPWVEAAPLMYEEIKASISPPDLESDLDRLSRLAERARPYLFRSAVYDLLLDHFEDRYGESGVCRSPMEFLLSFLRHPRAQERINAAAALDRRRPLLFEQRAHGGAPSFTSTPEWSGGLDPAAVISYQRSGGQLVINQMVSSNGGVLARFIPLAGTRSDAASFRDWIVRRSAPGVRHVEMAAAADVNGLQRPSGLFERLSWPTELPTAEPTVQLSDLTLTRSSDRTLMFRDQAGQPVQPVYLGATPAHMLFGCLRLMTTLAEPWLLPPLADEGWAAVPDSAQGVQHAARSYAGSIVLHRERWRLPATALPCPQPSETTSSLMRRARSWRVQLGIPDEVFATVHWKQFSLRPNKRKPVWVSFSSPHALFALSGLLRHGAAVSVELAEVLPRRSSEADQPSHHASELLGLVDWSPS